MPELTPVALLGFDASTRLALTDTLSATSRRQPGYRPVLGLDDARFVVVDAGHPEGLSLLRTLGRWDDALPMTLGAADAHGHRPPPDPAWLLAQLDARLVGLAPAHTPVSAHVSAHVSAPATAPAHAPAHAPSPWHEERDARRRRKAAESGWVAPRALLVDDSEIALHFLQRRLAPFGIGCDFARDSDRALDMLDQQRHGLVMLDLDLGDDSRLDGIALCQQLHQRWRPGGPPPPVVVIVSAFSGQVIQVRGTLAGASGFLAKPLDIAALAQLLQRLVGLPVAPAEADHA